MIYFRRLRPTSTIDSGGKGSEELGIRWCIQSAMPQAFSPQASSNAIRFKTPPVTTPVQGLRSPARRNASRSPERRAGGRSRSPPNTKQSRYEPMWSSLVSEDDHMQVASRVEILEERIFQEHDVGYQDALGLLVTPYPPPSSAAIDEHELVIALNPVSPHPCTDGALGCVSRLQHCLHGHCQQQAGHQPFAAPHRPTPERKW